MNGVRWQRNPGGSLVVHAIRELDSGGEIIEHGGGRVEFKSVITYCGKRMPLIVADVVNEKPLVYACMRCEQALAANGKLKARGSRTKVQ